MIKKITWDRIYSDALETDLYQSSEKYNNSTKIIFEIWQGKHDEWNWSIGYEYLDDNYEIMDSCEDTFEEAESQMLSWFNSARFERIFRLTFKEDRELAEEHKWVTIEVTFHPEYADLPQSVIIKMRKCPYQMKDGIFSYHYDDDTKIEVYTDTAMVRALVHCDVVYERFAHDKEELLSKVKEAIDVINKMVWI